MHIETKIKRRIYIFLAILLGILLAVIAYALVEKAHINRLLAAGEVPKQVGEHWYLPPSVAGIFLVGGMMLGYVLGVRWWQIIYVEKRRGRKLK